LACGLVKDWPSGIIPNFIASMARVLLALTPATESKVTPPDWTVELWQGKQLLLISAWTLAYVKGVVVVVEGEVVVAVDVAGVMMRLLGSVSVVAGAIPQPATMNIV